MSYQYDQYLQRHKTNVKRGYDWLRTNMPWIFEGKPDSAFQTKFSHDASKSNPDEYEAYDAYFYGGNRSHAIVEAFNQAWLLHIHRNPHHWQYWVLHNDDPNEGEVVLEMPFNYIIEMICDWWAFSWQKGDLSEIFSWYDDHQAYIKLHPKTRQTVEDILWELRDRLGYNVLAHHGIKGQKWGVRNGPPYPLDKSKESGTIKESRSPKISEDKFINYALNYDKAPDKARVFESALGYTKENCETLIKDIESHFDTELLEERGDQGHGMRYQQIMELTGPNGKTANVLTAWIEDGDNVRLTSVYVTKKEATKK